MKNRYWIALFIALGGLPSPALAIEMFTNFNNGMELGTLAYGIPEMPAARFHWWQRCNGQTSGMPAPGPAVMGAENAFARSSRAGGLRARGEPLRSTVFGGPAREQLEFPPVACRRLTARLAKNCAGKLALSGSAGECDPSLRAKGPGGGFCPSGPPLSLSADILGLLAVPNRRAASLRNSAKRLQTAARRGR